MHLHKHTHTHTHLFDSVVVLLPMHIGMRNVEERKTDRTRKRQIYGTGGPIEKRNKWGKGTENWSFSSDSRSVRKTNIETETIVCGCMCCIVLCVSVCACVWRRGIEQKTWQSVTFTRVLSIKPRILQSLGNSFRIIALERVMTWVGLAMCKLLGTLDSREPDFMATPRANAVLEPFWTLGDRLLLEEWNYDQAPYHQAIFNHAWPCDRLGSDFTGSLCYKS